MENKASLVSIIVPVYGTEAYLPACIESICNQSYVNIQIILVDDQSPDRCPEICDAYAHKDGRIQVIHQENKGVSGARNTGLRCADGEYVMFVDSDDELYPYAVELLLRDAFKYDADIVSATQRIVDKDKKDKIIGAFDEGSCIVLREDEPILLSLTGEKNTASACAKLFKTTFIHDIYFEEGKNIHEDGFFVFQCYIRKPILVQRDVMVYQYNIRSGSNSRQIFSDKYLSILYFLEQKKEIVTACFPQYSEEIRNMEVRTNLELLQVLCSSKDKKYRKLQTRCIRTVRKLRAYHKPINQHHKKLAWIVSCGLYPLYKQAVRIKYYR